MKYFLDTKGKNQEVGIFFTFSIVLLGVFLNQSNVMFGVNFSVADFFCGIAVLILVWRNSFQLPFFPTLFFLIVSISVISTAVYYVPSKFSYSPDTHKIISDYLKLIVVFVYFLLGYNIANLKLTDRTLQAYSLVALGIAIIGTTFTIFNIRIFSQILFFGGTRFRGLMNDPNYFSILQIAALVYFSRTKKVNVLLKDVAILFIVISIFTSGSKTGMVTLFCYLIFRVVEYIIITKKKLSTLITQLFFVVLCLIAVPAALNITQSLIDYLTTVIPSFIRVQTLFTDINTAISGGGSGRDITWKIALELIKSSPIVGIGVGTYSGIAKQFFGIGVFAHNTYLQLAVEWGVPIVFILFSYIFCLMGKVTLFYKGKDATSFIFILRDILIVFSIGSLAISLNNARFFWLVLGAFMVNVRNYKSSHDMNN